MIMNVFDIDNFRLCLHWVHLRKLGCGKSNTFWEQGRVFSSVQASGLVSNICLFSVSIQIKINIRDTLLSKFNFASYFCINQGHIYSIFLDVLSYIWTVNYRMSTFGDWEYKIGLRMCMEIYARLMGKGQILESRRALLRTIEYLPMMVH